MKKVLVLLVAAFAVFATGCSNDKTPAAAPPLMHIAKSFDTTVYTTKITTAPRYACDGHRLHQPKLTSIKSVAVPMHFNIDTTVGGSPYEKSTGTYGPIPVPVPSQEGTGVTGGSNDHRIGGIPAWLDDLFWIVAALILIALLIAFLWWLYNQMQRHVSTTAAADDASSHSYAAGAAGSNGAAAASGNASVTGTSADDVALLRQLQETGGIYNRYADGSVSMNIPEQFGNPSAIFIDITIVNERKEKEKRQKETK